MRVQVTNGYSRFNVVDDNRLVPCTTAKDASVVWADGNAEDANAITVLIFHLNWVGSGIATTKDFTGDPQSHALVSTGDKERTVGREIKCPNWFSVELNVDRTEWLLRKAEPIG